MEDLIEVARVSLHTPDPKAISSETFKKPFILMGEFRQGATVLDVRSVPNLLDVMGMPSGGGPPGFSVLTNKAAPKGLTLTLIAGFLPGSQIIVRSSLLQLSRHIGTCVTAGLMVNYFKFILDGGDNAPDPSSKEEVARFIEESGYLPVPLVEYVTPDVLLRGMAAETPGVPGG
jgi:hypothetical protein